MSDAPTRKSKPKPGDYRASQRALEDARSMVEARLIDAVQVYQRLPDRDLAFLAPKIEPMFKGYSGDYAGYVDPDDQKRETRQITLAATRAQIELADEALEWTACLSNEQRRVLGVVLVLKAGGASYRLFTLARRQLGYQSGQVSANALRLRYRRALTKMVLESV
jgi:hypothetical protein